MQFYNTIGEHKRTLQVPGTNLTSLAWELGSLKLCLTVVRSLLPPPCSPFTHPVPCLTLGYRTTSSTLPTCDPTTCGATLQTLVRARWHILLGGGATHVAIWLCTKTLAGSLTQVPLTEACPAVVYAFSKPQREEHCVIFWDVKRKNRIIKYVKNLVNIAAAGDNCVLCTKVKQAWQPSCGSPCRPCLSCRPRPRLRRLQLNI